MAQTTELVKKFGIKQKMVVVLYNAPPDFAQQLHPLPDGAELVDSFRDKADCIVGFVSSRADLRDIAPSVISSVREDGLLWFAYPKKSGPIKSDLSRDCGWEPVLREGFDSVAQIAIDSAWTGYRFRAKHLIGTKAANAKQSSS